MSSQTFLCSYDYKPDERGERDGGAGRERGVREKEREREEERER